jgi:lipoprotein-releasing system ATP-binding protein
MSNSVVLEAIKLSKTFSDAGRTIEIFKELDLKIEHGERVAIMGRSGAGKSTLLHLLGGLDLPTSGSVELAGKNFKKLNEKQRSKLRNKSLGFIYQFHHLLPEFTSLENVCIPLLFGNHSVRDATKKATAILEKVALRERLEHKVAQLSGGERQRVAIARALVTQPLCMLGDEPTGNLDAQTAEQVFSMMLNLNKELGISLVIVTHDQALANRMDRVLLLNNGKLEIA